MSTITDRRRYPRVPVRTPLRGTVGETRIFVLDVSAAGIGVAHQVPLEPPGRICRVQVITDIGPIKLDCAIVRTVKGISKDQARMLFTGLEVVGADAQSRARLRSVIEPPPPRS